MAATSHFKDLLLLKVLQIIATHPPPISTLGGVTGTQRCFHFNVFGQEPDLTVFYV